MTSVLWGAGDFLGGTLARRVAPFAVVGGSQFLATLVLAPVILLSGAPTDPPGWLPWGIAAGITGVLALGCFYWALAIGTMGVVAPVAAMGVVVPVLVGLVRGERPGAVVLAGIAVAVVGVVLAGAPEVSAVRHDTARGGWQALGLAGMAAVGFGLVLVFVAQGASASVGMTLLAQRCTGVTVALVVLARARHLGGLRRRDVGMLALIGMFDLGANATYAAASRLGLLAVVAVLASLYPVVTALLARVVHDERLAHSQVLGVGLALSGVALIAAGGAG
jgi:drug/metabolite transporter (DMT)-like permease